MKTWIFNAVFSCRKRRFKSYSIKKRTDKVKPRSSYEKEKAAKFIKESDTYYLNFTSK